MAYCSNTKIDWRYKNESLSDCKAFCEGSETSALIYREENRNCACCEYPPSVSTCSSCYMYTLTGIKYTYASFQ